MTDDHLTMKEGICRICGHQARLFGWEGVECLTCGSISAVAIPTNAELRKYYEEFLVSYHGGGRRKNTGRRQYAYAAKYLQSIRNIAGGKALIDIGSANSPFPNLAAEEGYDVSAVDLNQPDGLVPTVTFYQGSLEDNLVDRVGRTFDIVTAFAVLEHCPDPQLAIKNLVRLCDRGGSIVLTTPGIGRFSDRYAVGRSPWFNPPEHLNLISLKGLVELFGQSQCKLVSAGAFELNAVRYILRYGLGWCAGIAGWIVRNTARPYWNMCREKKISLVQDIMLYAFQKR